jgi:2-hydroxy-3-oxopropionate reductase
MKSTRSSITVSILGLGMMGRPMAKVLMDASYRVLGWNRSQVKAEKLEGIPFSQDLEMASQSEICLLMLADSQAVDAVIDQLEPHLSAGKLVMDMGTSDPSLSREHANRLSAKGIGWVDAPVSGGPEGAANGSLAIMAGGSEMDVARVRPILDALGSSVVRVGGPGAGHTTKLINQLIVAQTIEAVAEGLTLAQKCGLDPYEVQSALRGGFADSKILQIHGERMIKRAYIPGAKVRTQLKDLRLAQDLAASVSVELPHLKSTSARYQSLVEQGDGELDHSALHKLL